MHTGQHDLSEAAVGSMADSAQHLNRLETAATSAGRWNDAIGTRFVASRLHTQHKRHPPDLSR